jgi:hypothetical protein
LQIAVGELVVRAGSRQDVERFGGVALSAVADGGVDGLPRRGRRRSRVHGTGADGRLG